MEGINRELLEALRFYADPFNWISQHDLKTFKVIKKPKIIEDGGKKAFEAIAKAEALPAEPPIEGLREAIERYDSGDLCNTGGKWNDIAWQAARRQLRAQEGQIGGGAG